MVNKKGKKIMAMVVAICQNHPIDIVCTSWAFLIPRLKWVESNDNMKIDKKKGRSHLDLEDLD